MADGCSLRVGTGQRAAVDSGCTDDLTFPVVQHRLAVSQAVFSPLGDIVATASQDMTVRLHDRTGRLVLPPLQHLGAVARVEFSPDGKRLLTMTADEIRVWQVGAGRLAFPPIRHAGGFRFVTFSPDGLRLVATTNDRKARVWDGLTGVPATPFLGHANHVQTAAFRPDGKVVLTGSWGRSLYAWDGTTGKPVTMPGRAGLGLTKIKPNFPAAKLGLTIHDRLLKYNGAPLHQELDLHRERKRLENAGLKEVWLEYSQAGQVKRAKVPVGLLGVWIDNTARGQWDKLHSRDITRIVFSPDGRHVADDLTRCHRPSLGRQHGQGNRHRAAAQRFGGVGGVSSRQPAHRHVEQRRHGPGVGHRNRPATNSSSAPPRPGRHGRIPARTGDSC